MNGNRPPDLVAGGALGEGVTKVTPSTVGVTVGLVVTAFELVGVAVGELVCVPPGMQAGALAVVCANPVKVAVGDATAGGRSGAMFDGVGEGVTT